MKSRVIRCAKVTALLLAPSLAMAPAAAQDAIDPELTRLVEAGLSPQTALAEAARQQGEGDLPGAASTLERALIAHPGADAVRIELVTVLCNLDDRGSARLELDLLRGRIIGSEGWNRMVAACGAEFAGNRRRVGEFNASISAGLAYDQNAAEQLTSYEVFGIETRDGLAAIGSVQADAKIPAGSGYIYSSAIAQAHYRLSGADNEFQYGQAMFGYGKEVGNTGISAGAVIRNGWLFGDNHVTAYGGQLRLARHIGNSSQIVGAAEVVHEDYSENVFNGTHYDMTVGFDHTTSTLQRYYFGIGADRKAAGANFADYAGFRLAGSAELPLGTGGTTLAGSLTLRRVVFDKEPGEARIKQWRLFARLGAQIPLAGQRLFVEPAVTYRRRDYNSAGPSAIYSSLGGQLSLVWQL